MRYWFFIIIPYVSFAQDFSFFKEDKKIDYWANVNSKNKNKNNKNDKNPDESFDWNLYLNPNNKEFFKEGNYVPPVPFMEVIKNPNEENIKNWFLMIEVKNNLMNRLRENILLYLKKNSNLKDNERSAIIQESERSLGQKDQFNNRDIIQKYAFQLYFDSKCPFSLKMIDSVLQLRNEGFYVEFIQVDDGNSSVQSRVPVMKASAQDLKLNKITATPVLFVKELHNKTTIRIDGFMSGGDIINKIQNKGIGEL